MSSEVRVRRPSADVPTGLRPIDPPLSTAAWYGDPLFELAFPADWSVVVHEPDLPQPLDDDQMLAALRDPVSAPRLAVIAKSARRVVIIVDDLTRPTPAEPVLRLLLGELESVGLKREDVTIVVGTGTHGPASADAMQRKVGRSAQGCRLISHDDLGDCQKVGVTRMGTPVFVNREVLGADLVIGVGGVYPQHSTGFGGGSKLAIGVLGRASISRLHFGRESMDGRYDIDNDFRADLDEIAMLVGLRWSVMVHVNGRREIVRLVAGDPKQAYPAAAAFARERFAAPLPSDADVVIANAYPLDISATFMRSKGVIPLLRARVGASRILLAACPEGVGHHGLFPLEPPTGFRLLRRRAEIVRARGWPEVARLARAVARRPFRRTVAESAPRPHSILMYRTIESPLALPPNMSGIELVPTWSGVIDTIRSQQQHRGGLRVVVYPCAPLQVLER